jgi:hypothetical protein
MGDVHPGMKDMLKTEAQNIYNKAEVRTALFAEKFYAPKPADARPAEIKSYEENFFDNINSSLYDDERAAELWAALNGFSPEDVATLQITPDNTVEFARAVVVVPVNSRHYTWEEEGDVKVGTPYICVHQGNGAFMDAEGNKVHLGTLDYAIRPATADEIKEVVDGLLKVRPAQFIKNLGDTLAGVELGS